MYIKPIISIDEFLKEMDLEGKVVAVRCVPGDGAKENQSFSNVLLDIGKIAYGWAIWQRGNMYLKAEAYAVVERDGGFIDVTPHEEGIDEIIFVPDGSLSYEGKRIPDRFHALNDSKLVAEYIDLWNQKEEIVAGGEVSGRAITLTEEEAARYRNADARMKVLDSEFEKEAGRNDSCPCGSGLKFKNCCGKYR